MALFWASIPSTMLAIDTMIDIFLRLDIGALAKLPGPSSILPMPLLGMPTRLHRRRLDASREAASGQSWRRSSLGEVAAGDGTEEPGD